MSALLEVLIPDLGDFDVVPIIEIFVKVGDAIEIDDPLIALESDKATMEIPATTAGVVREILCSVGDNVGQGQPILKLELLSDSLSIDQPETDSRKLVDIGSNANGPIQESAQRLAQSSPSSTPTSTTNEDNQ